MNDCRDDGSEFEQIWEVLSHPTRRALLRALRKIETPTTIEGIAGELVDSEENRPDGVERTEKIERVEIALHHTHLPKMADIGAINYDPETGTIGTSNTTDNVCDVLDSVSDESGF